MTAARDPRWTDETEALVAIHITGDPQDREPARAVLDALFESGVLLPPDAMEHEHRDECERCDHLDGSICPECPLAAPSAPETAEPCPRWHTTAVDAAKAVARELGVQAVIAGELVDAVKALKAELEMAEQDRDLARQAAEGRQRERDAVRVVIVGAPERRPT